jgi:4-coumarate--CoA ligase
VVSICASNSIWYPVAMFGVMRAGFVGALSSPGYGEEEMMHAFRTVGCKVVVCDRNALETVNRATRRLGISEDRIVLLDEGVNGFKSLREIIDMQRTCEEGNEVQQYEIPAGKLNSEICALLCFSSGTTGLPKAVCVVTSNLQVLSL